MKGVQSQYPIGCVHCSSFPAAHATSFSVGLNRTLAAFSLPPNFKVAWHFDRPPSLPIPCGRLGCGGGCLKSACVSPSSLLCATRIVPRRMRLVPNWVRPPARTFVHMCPCALPQPLQTQVDTLDSSYFHQSVLPSDKELKAIEHTSVAISANGWTLWGFVW